MTGPDETLLDLALARSGVDRAAHERADASTVARALDDPRTRVLTLWGARAAVVRPADPAGGASWRLHLRGPAPGDAGLDPWFLGRRDGVAHLAVRVPPGPGGVEASLPHGGTWGDLREVGADLDDTDSGLLTTATALAGWHGRHLHCPRCGARTDVVLGGWVRRCPVDGSEHHPRTDPAVIMAVVDGDDRILLATGVSWPEQRVSVLAGFVEAGETMEAAVAREVQEEVGVRVSDLVYRGNQPWPYPGSLMLAFRARAVTTRLRPDPAELRSAGWYDRETLGAQVGAGRLTLPSRASIARRLIEDWYGGPVVGPVVGPDEGRR